MVAASRPAGATDVARIILTARPTHAATVSMSSLRPICCSNRCRPSLRGTCSSELQPPLRRSSLFCELSPPRSASMTTPYPGASCGQREWNLTPTHASIYAAVSSDEEIHVREEYVTSSRGMCLLSSTTVPRQVPVRGVVCYCHKYSSTPTGANRAKWRRLTQAGYASLII